MLRFASKGDIPQLQALWREAFGDSPEYIAGFYNINFSPELAVLLELDGSVCAMAHLLPSELIFRGVRLPARYIYAVAVKRELRGRGFGGELMRFAVRWLEQNRLGGFLGRMFGVGGLLAAGNPFDWLYALRGYGVTLLLGCILSLPVIKNGHQKLISRFGETKTITAVETVLLGIVLILSVAYLVASPYNPFIYWNFWGGGANK